ncbi:MAG: nuclear transport factor 2 family protein [Aureliella sp.]
MKQFYRVSLAVVTFLAAISLSQTAKAQTNDLNPSTQQNQETAQVEPIRASSAAMVSAFNAGRVESAASIFLPTGELIDEDGAIYKGQEEIKELLSALFEKFPGVQLSLEAESFRVVGPAVIEEGTRVLTVSDSKTSANFRYIDVWVQVGSDWKLASHREMADDPVPTANDHLQSVAWLEGSWINEGADGSVAIHFQWSEDKNFLLGEFVATDATGSTRKSSQRIGWDARAGNIRSWLFDADGGFSEGVWVVVEDEVVVKSTSVNPDGTSASATLSLKPSDKDHFTFSGTERIVDGRQEPDFELTISRSPMPASK